MKKIFRCYKCYSQEWDEWGLDTEKILEDTPENRRAFALEYCGVNALEINDFINMKKNEYTHEIDYDWDEPSAYNLEVIDINDEIKKLEEKIAQLKLYNK
jgi:hypothetical protein